MIFISCRTVQSSFPRTHDHCSTARFHESDAWLSLTTLRHGPYERVVHLELGQGVCRLVHHNSTVRRTPSSTRDAERTPVFEWYMRRVVCHSCSVCGRFRSTQRPRCFRLAGYVKLSGLICIGDCSACPQLRLLELLDPRHRHPRGLLRPRHLPRSLQPSPKLFDEEFHSRG